MVFRSHHHSAVKIFDSLATATWLKLSNYSFKPDTALGGGIIMKVSCKRKANCCLSISIPTVFAQGSAAEQKKHSTDFKTRNLQPDTMLVPFWKCDRDYQDSRGVYSEQCVQGGGIGGGSRRNLASMGVLDKCVLSYWCAINSRVAACGWTM